MSKKRLGRGLDALLSDRSKADEPAPVAANTGDATASATLPEETSAAGGGVSTVNVAEVVPSPYQPRRHFDDEALADLANSIKQSGLLQPIVVRERAQGGFELIAGERRLRAAGMAGLVQLPAIVRTVTDEEASALALIENIQREDLSALEEARGLARLRDEFELTQQQIADAVGKSRVAIANLLRLLNLGTLARQFLENGDLDMGHARALLGLTGIDQDRAAQQVVEGGLTVRQTEELVRRIEAGVDKPASKKTAQKDADTQRLEQRLTDHLGAPVQIRHNDRGKGEVTIRYSTLEELDGVLGHLGLAPED